MMNLTRMQCLAATTAVLAAASSPAFAQNVPANAPEPGAEDSAPPRASINFLDLTAGLGYSSNPRIRAGDSQGSVFGRASVRGVHAGNSERTSYSVTGFVEGSTYFNEYGLQSIFAVNGSVSHQASERVAIFGSAGVNGDISGQLSNRFLYVPEAPPVVDPTVPPPITVVDPDLFSFSGREYRIHANAGASFGVSPNSSMTLSAGANRVILTSASLDDYTTIFGSGSYNRTLSERTTVGVRISANRTEYDGTSDHSTVINPEFTIRTRLSEYWDADAAVGLSFSMVDRGIADENSTNISLRGSLCHTTESERLCGRVSRFAQTASSTALVTTTSAGVDWYKELDPNQTLQLSASVSRFVSEDVVNDNEGTNHYRIAASYSRRINQRFSVGADVSARRLSQEGPDPDTDFGASLFLRYRLGDLG
jgi:Tfp pilus assembly protein PilX